MNIEKILRNFDSFLESLGLDEEDRKEILEGIQSDDDEEEVEETEQDEEETPTEETPVEEKPTEEAEELSQEETPAEEEGVKPVEEAPEEAPAEGTDKSEELQKTFDGLTARIQSLEETVSKLTGLVEKLGVPEDKEAGLSPNQEGEVKGEMSYFDRINKLRTGK